MADQDILSNESSLGSIQIKEHDIQVYQQQEHKPHILKYVPINLRLDQSCKKRILFLAIFYFCLTSYFLLVEIQQDRWRKSAGGRSGSVLSGGSGPVVLMVVVCSAVSNFGARTAIRKSWGSEARSLPGVKVVFLVGKINSVQMIKGKLRSPKDLQQQVQEENLEHGDILQKGFIDTYRNLTLKSLALLRLVADLCKGPKDEKGGGCPQHVLKTDDDMYINLSALLMVAQSQGTVKKVLLGALICGSKPTQDRTSKWFVPNNRFVFKTYPPYLSGTAYLMSRSTVKSLHAAAKHQATFPLEDVFVTGILAARAGIRPRDHPGFSYRHRKLEPCSVTRTVTTHRVGPGEMVDLWKSIKKMKGEGNKACHGEKRWLSREHGPGKCPWPL